MFARQGFPPFLAGLFFVVAEGLSGCGDGGEIEEAPDQDGGPGEVDAGPAVVTLTVVLEGRGSGTVESDDVDIVGGDQLRCGFEEDESCSVQVVEGTTVLLEAQPTPPSRFGSFDSPACENDDQACLASIGTEDLVIEVSFLLGEIQLDVTVDGDGDGTVTSEPAGIDCGANCGSPFDEDEDVTLTASPDEASSEFLGWSGDCADAGMNATCILEGVDRDLDVGAAFGLRTFETTAMVLGAGAGSVVEDTSGIDCPDDTCQGTATFGDRLRFVATPAANAVVASWGGACAGTPAASACSVTVEGDVAVTVTFELRRWTVTVDPTGGTGDGTVTGTPGSIDCSTDTPGPVGTCTASITDGETVILTPTAVAATSSFEGWTGCDREVAEACEVDVTSARSVTASFDLLPRDLVVATGGTGSGEVTVTPTGGSAIACADRCTETLLHGTVVTLTAAPNASTSSFDGWTGGGCTGTAACTVTMDVARSVTATFTLLPRDLVVNAVGTGSGTVTVTPAGGSAIACGAGCTETFPHRTMVTLVATPTAATSGFDGWAGGGCAGTGACTVTMDMARTVTATFTLLPRTVTTTTGGTGSGSVSGAGTVPHGTLVTLTATPEDVGSEFSGWTGACAGQPATCTLTVTADTTTTALFDPVFFTVTVTVGEGGSVTSAPPGIDDCTGTCDASFRGATDITLTATDDPGFDFDEWTGDATGTDADLTVTVEAGAAITASFESVPEILGLWPKTVPGDGLVLVRGLNLDDASSIEIGSTTITTLPYVTDSAVVFQAPSTLTSATAVEVNTPLGSGLSSELLDIDDDAGPLGAPAAPATPLEPQAPVGDAVRIPPVINRWRNENGPDSYQIGVGDSVGTSTDAFRCDPGIESLILTLPDEVTGDPVDSGTLDCATGFFRLDIPIGGSDITYGGVVDDNDSCVVPSPAEDWCCDFTYRYVLFPREEGEQLIITFSPDGDSDALCTPACDDGRQNGEETDVDCGGGDCPRCTDGKMCEGDEDCVEGSCDADGICTSS